MIVAAIRKKQEVNTQCYTLPQSYKPRGATRAQQQSGGHVETGASIELPRRAVVKNEQPQIEISAPGAGYIAVHRPDSAEPQLIRVVRQLQGATKARNVSQAAASDGVKLARQSSEPFARRRQTTGYVADTPAWRERGLFKAGFTQGPRLKGTKLFTKGKA